MRPISLHIMYSVQALRVNILHVLVSGHSDTACSQILVSKIATSYID